MSAEGKPALEREPHSLEEELKHLLRKVGLSLFCLCAGAGGFAQAKEASPKDKSAPEDQNKRRMEGEPADSPRLQLPLDVFDASAARQSFSAMRAAYCPTAEGYLWGQLNGAAGVDENYGVAAACDRVFLLGNAQGQLGTRPGQGGTDIVIRSTKADGSPDWLQHFGTSANDYAVAAALGPDRSDCNNLPLYVAGYTSGALTTAAKSGTDADVFLIAYTATTHNEQWRIQFGGTGNDYAYGVATDSTGNVYVVGATGSNLGGGRTPPSGTTDMFIAKYSPTGTRLWVRQAGVNGKFTTARGVSVGANGNVYVVGYTSGNLYGNVGGSYDIFIASYSNTGSAQGQTMLGTGGADLGYGIATSLEGGRTYVYVTGQTDSFFPGTATHGQYDVVTAKYNDSLTTRVWLNQEGGPTNDYAYSIAFSERGEIIVGGASETDFNTGASLGSSDTLMLTYKTNGFRLFSDHLGSPAREVVRALAVDGQRVYLAGSSDGMLCNSTPNGTFTGGVLDSLVISFDSGCRINTTDPRCHPGTCHGDPHCITYDRLAYDFQAGGEFILSRYTGDSSFEVQERQCSSGSIAVIKGIGARVGSDRIELYPDNTAFLNGARVDVAAPIRLSGGGQFYKSGTSSYVVAWPSGERLLSTAYGSLINVYLYAPAWRLGGYMGLLGDGDGSKDNEFTLRDGTPMSSIPSFLELYRGADSFANQWRVDPAKDTVLLQRGETCTDLTAPATYVSSSTLTPAQQAAGESACANITNPTVRENCILDVGLTGDPSLAANMNDVSIQLVTGGVKPDSISEIRGVYFNNFTGDIGPEWDSIASSVTPMGNRRFLGEFGNQNVRLTLNNLAKHTRLKVSFDLFIINAWTGDDGYFGSPTVWTAAADGTPLSNYTFSNWNGTAQSYPTPFMPAQSGAKEANTLGYPYSDSVYRITLEFNHTAPTVALDLAAQGLSGVLGESWGVANFEIMGR